MVTGENAGTWGENTNNNLNLIQQAIAGYEAVALTDGGTVALAMTDKALSNARNMVIKFTGTLTTASTVTIPDSIEKFYIFDCSAVVAPTNLTIKTASGTGFTLDRAAIYAAYADGTNLNEISLDTLGGTVAAAQVTPAGSDTQIQFNDGGALGASSNLTWDDTNLTIGSAAGAIKLTDSDQSHSVSLKAGAMTANATFVLPTADGTCGQALTTDGSGNLSFADAGGGAITWDTTAKTTTVTAVAGNGYFVDTTSGSVTVNLPAGSAGDQVAIADYAGTFQNNACTITPNGTDKIGGTNASAALIQEGQGATFVFVDSTQGWLAVSDATSNPRASDYIVATGGTVTECGDFKTHIFTGPGTFSVTSGGSACGSNTVEYFVLAGGGGATGASGSGGGGGGGYRTNYPGSAPISAGAFPITVGGGGSCASGSNSVFSCITAAGGGRGGSASGSQGGSGGGAGGAFVPAQPGPFTHCGGAGNTPPVSPSQGNPGGQGFYQPGPPAYRGGGGGGASQAGEPGSQPKKGGDGSPLSPTMIGACAASYGTPGPAPGRWFAGGGGGNQTFPCNVRGAGGAGGGAQGGTFDGTTNTGGGGGGGTLSPTVTTPPGNGGSGIVMIRYRFQN
jgi:hypothetical protein